MSSSFSNGKEIQKNRKILKLFKNRNTHYQIIGVDDYFNGWVEREVKKKKKHLTFFFFSFFCQERRTPRLMSRMVRGCRAKEKKRHLSAAQGRLSSAPMAVSTIVDFFFNWSEESHTRLLSFCCTRDRQTGGKKKK